MYLPATIWFTVLAGMGENPGPTTNGCCRIGKEKPRPDEVATDEAANETPPVKAELATEHGEAKVDKKEGTEKLGLPCEPGVRLLELTL